MGKIKEKAKIMEEAEIDKALSRLAHEILEKVPERKKLAIIGIKNRGAYLAKRLVGKIAGITKKEPPLGVLDITLYRDDLSAVGPQPVVRSTEIPFDITGKIVILVITQFSGTEPVFIGQPIVTGEQVGPARKFAPEKHPCAVDRFAVRISDSNVQSYCVGVPVNNIVQQSITAIGYYQ